MNKKQREEPGERSYDPGGPRDNPSFERARSSGGSAHETPAIHRLLVESVREYAIFALDSTGHILTWNAGAQRFKGWRAEEIIGTHFSAFYPPEDIANGKPERELREAARRGSVEDEGWRLRKDGSRFWANVVITALRDASGELVGFAKVTRDLTERRAAEEQLRESEERFRLLVQSVKDYAIFMLDPDGRVATWNEGAERIKGYTAEEIIGRHFSTFYPAEAVATKFPQHELKVATQVGRFEDEGWRVRKDGSFFWASVVITALFSAKGKLVGFAKVTRDLTERRQAQERAIADARRVAESEAANRAKSEFLATLSHELRTPLNAIGGYADLLVLEVAGEVNESQRQYLERIKTSQRHLLALVNDLLNISRLEAGQVEYRLEPLPVLSLLREMEAMILPQAVEKDITFEITTCPPEAIALADSARTQQILLNLLANAIKFTPSSGRVSVACSASEGQIGISVIDTGPGIPTEKQEAIFEPFVQLGRSLTTGGEGAGLGLAISRRLARAMSGDLKVASDVDEGSTFTLILPRYTE
jgi:PAS domain S-box-containing protein